MNQFFSNIFLPFLGSLSVIGVSGVGVDEAISIAYRMIFKLIHVYVIRSSITSKKDQYWISIENGYGFFFSNGNDANNIEIDCLPPLNIMISGWRRREDIFNYF